MGETYYNYRSIATLLFSSAAVVVILAAVALIPLIMLQAFFGDNKFKVKGKTVLLVGASEGLGRALATVLAKKGASVVVVARNATKLADVVAEAQAAKVLNNQRFHFITADLFDETSAEHILAETTTWNNGRAPDVVWAVAGASYPLLFLESTLSEMRKQMDINYWSCVQIAQSTLKRWLVPGSEDVERHLIFTSSAAAFVPAAGYAPYAPGKAAIKSLSDCLTQEVLLYSEKVKVHTIFPGGISSPGFENENIRKPDITHILEEPDTSSMQTPEEAAEKSVRGLENGEYLVTLNLLGSMMRAAAWGGSRRNNWFVDSVLSFVINPAWFFIGRDLDSKVRKFARENGHPSTYPKKS